MLKSNPVRERFAECEVLLEQFRVGGLGFSPKDTFHLRRWYSQWVVKSRFRRSWKLVFPASSSAEVLAKAPVKYMILLRSVYKLDELYGDRLFSYSLFLAQAHTAYHVLGIEALQKVIERGNSKLANHALPIEPKGSTAMGVAVAASLAGELGWSAFSVETLESTRNRLGGELFEAHPVNSAQMPGLLSDVVKMLDDLRSHA